MKNIASGFLGTAVVALVLSGCGASGAEPEPSATPTPVAASDGFLCSRVPISRKAVETRVPVRDMGEPGRTVLSEATWDDGRPLDLLDEGWFVATTSDELVGVMRDLDVEANPASTGTLLDHEILTIRWVDDATNLTPGWYVWQSDTCALTVDLGDLVVPRVELQFPPDPMSRKLRLLVTEEDCNSGMDADGRIEVVSIDETDSRVSLVLGVRPSGGSQTCPLNPSTPFTVTLSEPLGEREVVDASLANPRPLTTNQ